MRVQIVNFLKENGIRAADDAELVPRYQIMLLGGNSLPIRVAAAALSPIEVLLLTTPEVNSPIGALREQLAPGVVRVKLLEQSWDRFTLEGILDEWWQELKSRPDGPGPVGLHYTGGTKSMVAYAHHWWWRRFGKVPESDTTEHQCTYLRGTEDELVFDGLARAFSLGKIDVRLSQIFALHGMEIKSSRTEAVSRQLAEGIGDTCIQQRKFKEYQRALPPWNPENISIDAVEVRAGIPDIAGKKVRVEIRANHESNYGERGAFGNWSFREVSELCPAILADATWKTIPGLASKRPQKILQYLATDWFEDWFLLRLHNHLEDNHLEDLCNVILLLPGSGEPGSGEIELDIVGRRGHIPVLFSCTTGASKGEVKLKAMEAAWRARQLGGDLARYVLCCFAESDQVLTQIWLEMFSRADKTDLFRVLGLPHYRGEAAVTHCQALVPVKETLDEMLANWRP